MSHRRAFTLIELLIVITIIGILAVALIPKIANAPSRARDTQRKADLNQIAKGLEAYFSDYGIYPTNPTIAGNKKYCVDAISSFSSYFNASDIPNDPSGDSGGVSSSITNCTGTAYSSAGEYFYKQLDSGQHYVISADLENEPASGTQTQNIIISSTASGASSLGDASSGLYAAMQSGEDCAASGCMFVMAK